MIMPFLISYFIAFLGFCGAFKVRLAGRLACPRSSDVLFSCALFPSEIEFIGHLGVLMLHT